MRIKVLATNVEAADHCIIKLIINVINVLVGYNSKYLSGESLKSSYRDVLLGFAADLWRLYPFLPRGAQLRLSDTKSRPCFHVLATGTTRSLERCGYGA